MLPVGHLTFLFPLSLSVEAGTTLRSTSRAWVGARPVSSLINSARFSRQKLCFCSVVQNYPMLAVSAVAGAGHSGLELYLCW
jgi:hypothetical protein